MRAPNLNALRMFDAAARHLNFRRASEELNVTQGAVAQQVRRLEADLGLQLFVAKPVDWRSLRSAGLPRPGPSGHRNYRQQPKNCGPKVKSITVSVTPSFASKWFVPRLVSFTRAHPTIDVRTIASEDLATSVPMVDIHSAGTPTLEKGLSIELLAHLDLVPCAAPAMRVNLRKFVGLRISLITRSYRTAMVIGMPYSKMPVSQPRTE